MNKSWKMFLQFIRENTKEIFSIFLFVVVFGYLAEQKYVDHQVGSAYESLRSAVEEVVTPTPDNSGVTNESETTEALITPSIYTTDEDTSHRNKPMWL